MIAEIYEVIASVVVTGAGLAIIALVIIQTTHIF